MFPYNQCYSGTFVKIIKKNLDIILIKFHASFQFHEVFLISVFCPVQVTTPNWLPCLLNISRLWQFLRLPSVCWAAPGQETVDWPSEDLWDFFFHCKNRVLGFLRRPQVGRTILLTSICMAVYTADRFWCPPWPRCRRGFSPTDCSLSLFFPHSSGRGFRGNKELFT